MPTVVQIVGAALVVAALVVLAGPWWAALAAGTALVVLGYLAERAEPRTARSAPSVRPGAPNAAGVE